MMDFDWLSNIHQARSQDFGGEGARFWVPAPKGGQGASPGKFLKNVPVIWCIILHRLHKVPLFSERQSVTFFLWIYLKQIFTTVKNLTGN